MKRHSEYRCEVRELREQMMARPMRGVRKQDQEDLVQDVFAGFAKTGRTYVEETEGDRVDWCDQGIGAAVQRRKWIVSDRRARLREGREVLGPDPLLQLPHCAGIRPDERDWAVTRTPLPIDERMASLPGRLRRELLDADSVVRPAALIANAARALVPALSETEAMLYAVQVTEDLDLRQLAVRNSRSYGTLRNQSASMKKKVRAWSEHQGDQVS